MGAEDVVRFMGGAGTMRHLLSVPSIHSVNDEPWLPTVGTRKKIYESAASEKGKPSRADRSRCTR